MINKLRNFGVTTIFILSFVIFCFGGIFLKGNGYSSSLSVLISVASFLFGVFIAFSASDNHAKVNRINECLKTDEAWLLSIYQLASIYDQETKKRIQSLIDAYLISQIDYFLEDFNQTYPAFKSLYDYCQQLEFNHKKQEIAYSKIIDCLNNIQNNRKKVEILVKQKMLKIEWVALLTLLGLILILVFYFNNGSPLSILLTALLSSAAILLVMVLRELDNLHWKESSMIWEPLNDTFKALDLLPYYPKNVLISRRTRPSRNSVIRIADYPNKYPDMTGKTVKKVLVKKDF
jgi:hypothetical protein